MSETRYIAEMADKVATELFQIFKWQRKVAEDQSWKCVTPEVHDNKKDHPSDCVFFYRDPYDNQIKYINTDLKSYSKTSINKIQIGKAMHSLSYAINCAPFNPNWKSLFKPEDDFSVLGMLFVYNHCGTYNGNFDEVISEIDEENNHLDDGRMIYICDPYKITELNSIANDIMIMIGKGELPQIDRFSFYHPNEILIKNHFDQDYSEPATINVLSSPWIIIKHAECNKSDAGYLIYYTREGKEVEEFTYFIDALSYYQIINNNRNVRIKLTKANTHGTLNLITAIKKYYKHLGRDDDQAEKIANEMVKGTIAKVIPQFSSIELGVIK